MIFKKTNPPLPSGCLSFHLDRAAGGDCHHCHSGRDAVACLGQGQAKGAWNFLPNNHKQLTLGWILYAEDYGGNLPASSGQSYLKGPEWTGGGVLRMPCGGAADHDPDARGVSRTAPFGPTSMPSRCSNAQLIAVRAGCRGSSYPACAAWR